jgi:cytidylate kinase
MAHPNFYRITVTGDPGSGKSTFAKAVSEKLGYRLITTGNIFRQLAAERGISLTELNELAETQAEIDHEVDNYLKLLNQSTENMVLDSRMGWFFVRECLKVRLTVDPDVAANRIFKDTAELREKFSDIDTAIDEVERRKKSEILRYKKLYGVDISDVSNFNLVINTSRKAPNDITREFEQKFEEYKKHIRETH